MKATILGLAALIAMAAPVLGQITNGTEDADSGGWQSMDTAPKDGSIIEIMNTYGLVPWYGLFKWSKVQNIGGPEDKMKECTGLSPYETYPVHTFLGFQWGGFTQAEWGHYMATQCHDRKPYSYVMDKPNWVGVGAQTGSGVICTPADTCHWRRP